MNKPPDEHPPPDSRDLEGWRRAVADGSYKQFRMEDIVAAIQDLGPCTDKAVLNPLAQHLSDVLLRILRKKVSTSHRNRGVDLIERTADQIIDAVLQPASADGKALRVAFVPRVEFRLKDALNAAAAAARNEELYEADKASTQCGLTTRRGKDGTAQELTPKDAAACALGGCMDVEQILEQIPHGQKRLAFRLFMDDIPFKSKKSASIADALGISEKTAREWVKEVQALLSTVPAAQELLKSNE